jgi:hypothetical protein
MFLRFHNGVYEEADTDNVWVWYYHNRTDFNVSIHVNELFPALPGKASKPDEDIMVFILSGDYAGQIGKVIKWGKKAKLAVLKIGEETVSLGFSALIKITPVEKGKELE